MNSKKVGLDVPPGALEEVGSLSEMAKRLENEEVLRWWRSGMKLGAKDELEVELEVEMTRKGRKDPNNGR